MIPSNEKKLREIGLLSLEKKMLCGDFAAAFEDLKVSYKKDGDEHFIRACCDRTRKNVFRNSL